jgi:hypothetical protein
MFDPDMQLCVVRGVFFRRPMELDLLMLEVVMAAGKTPLRMFDLVMDVVRERRDNAA